MLTFLQDRMEALATNLTERVTELQKADSKWSEYYTQINIFSDWLTDKQTDLKEVHESEATPDQQFDQAKVWRNNQNLLCQNIISFKFLFLSVTANSYWQ